MTKTVSTGLLSSVALVAFFALVFASVALAVGTNGSFEVGTPPGSYTTHSAGDPDITGWTIDSGSVDYIGSYWQASDGERSIDLNGLEAGTISQTFPTVIGATYDVTFDLSGNPDGLPSMKEVSVSATGAAPSSFFYDTSVEGNTHASMEWNQEMYSFVATAVSTTLSFESQIAGAFGPALDNVSITETIPPIACESPETQTLVSDTANNTVATGDAPAVAVTPHAAWTATIPGSTTWIWETGPTSVDETVAFEQTFTVSGPVLSATLDIAADNSYKVFIDGTEVAADSADNNFQIATQDTYDLTADVTPGTHTLRIEVKNHGTFNASGNPAGLLYKFEVETCNDPTPPPPPPVDACETPLVAPAGYTLQNGTPGNDTVTLTPNTMFVGMGGNDKVSAPDGNYIICLENGNDKVMLDNGDYTISAGGGNNKITTGDGDGAIMAGAGNDKITTGDGDHTIDAGNGNNKIVTGDGTQDVTVGSGNDKITTGSGGDTISAGSGNNKVNSGGGDDSVTALGGNDKINGGPDTDTCDAGGGNNTVVNCEL